MTCPECASNKVIKRGFRNNRQRFKCLSCGTWFSEKSVVLDRNTPLKNRLKDCLENKPQSIKQLSARLKETPQSIESALKELQEEKYNILRVGDAFELSSIVEPYSKKRLEYSCWNNHRLRLGFVADTHLCSKFERLDALNLIYDIFQNEGIALVYHGGNYIDGECRFNKYEIHTVGLTPQVDYFIQNYPKREGVTTRFISGDDHEGWYIQRERINIGEYTQLKAEKANRTDLEYIGHVEVDIQLEGIEGNSWMRLMHGGGGSAYAYSYIPQKLVESYSGGEKCRVLLLGHYHKLEYCYPREVHVISMGSFQDQTIFMRKNKMQSHIGGGILEMNQAPDGTINRVKVEFITFFDKGFYLGKNKYWR